MPSNNSANLSIKRSNSVKSSVTTRTAQSTQSQSLVNGAMAGLRSNQSPSLSRRFFQAPLSSFRIKKTSSDSFVRDQGYLKNEYHDSASVSQYSSVSKQSTVSYKPESADTAAIDLEAYICLFSIVINHQLGITATPQPNSIYALLLDNFNVQHGKNSQDPDFSQKKRAIYQVKMIKQLNYLVQCNLSLRDAKPSHIFHSGKLAAQASIIGTVFGMSITTAMGVDLATGGITTGITATALLGFFIYQYIKKRTEHKNAKILGPYLSEADSNVVHLIASLATLYAVETLNSTLHVKHAMRFTFKPADFKKVFNKLYNGDQSETHDIDAQLKAVYKLAKNDADKIFENLLSYAKKGKHRRVDRELFKALPNFIFEKEFSSVELTQTTNHLFAWLGALSMTIEGKDCIHARTFYGALSGIRSQVAAEALALKTQAANQPGSQLTEDEGFDENLSTVSSQQSSSERTLAWVMQNSSLENHSVSTSSSVSNFFHSANSNKPGTTSNASTIEAEQKYRSTRTPGCA